jgi:hypothetical protein
MFSLQARILLLYTFTVSLSLTKYDPSCTSQFMSSRIKYWFIYLIVSVLDMTPSYKYLLLNLFGTWYRIVMHICPSKPREKWLRVAVWGRIAVAKRCCSCCQEMQMLPLPSDCVHSNALALSVTVISLVLESAVESFLLVAVSEVPCTTLSLSLSYRENAELGRWIGTEQSKAVSLSICLSVTLLS